MLAAWVQTVQYRIQLLPYLLLMEDLPMHLAARMLRLEIRTLRYFVAVVDAGSMSQAASIVGIAQPALSLRMTQLEDIVESQLLVRSRVGVKPTASGWALYRHAEQILKMVLHTGAVISGKGMHLTGRVRLGLPSSIAVVLAAPLLEAVRMAHPGIQLELHESPSAYLGSELLNGRFDLSFVVESVPGLSLTPLLDETLFYVTGSSKKAMKKEGPITLSNLADVPLVLTTRSTTLRRVLDTAFARADIQPLVHAEVSSIPTVLLLVLEGVGGAIVPGAAISASHPSLHLSAHAISPPIIRRASLGHALSAPPSAETEAVRKVLVETSKYLIHSKQWLGASFVCAD